MYSQPPHTKKEVEGEEEGGLPMRCTIESLSQKSFFWETRNRKNNFSTSKNTLSKKSHSTTCNDLKKLPNWKNLSKRDQRFLMLGFPKRFRRVSINKLATEWKISKSSAVKNIDSYTAKGWIKKEHRFLKSHGKTTKIHTSNYYVVEKEGQKHMKKLLDFLFEDYQKPTDKENQYQKIFQIFFSHTRIGNTYVLKNKPRGDLPTPSSSSLEERSFSVVLSKESLLSSSSIFKSALESSPPDPKTHKTTPQNENLDAKKRTYQPSNFKDCPLNGEKFRAIKKIFINFKFSKQLSKAYYGTLLKLLTYSLDSIEKLLKLIRHKLSKGWKLRSFWAFFLHEIQKAPRKKRFAKKWFPFLAGEYRDATDGKQNKLMKGQDTSMIVASITKLEKETEEKITEKHLEKLLHYNTQNVKTALDMICYRLSLGKGELPEDKTSKEEGQPEKKGRPIYQMVKVNIKTKKPYTEKDRYQGVPFAFTNKIVGYENPQGEPKKYQEPPTEKRKRKITPIKSWIGMSFYALKLGSPWAITKAFCEKRGERPCMS